MGRSPCCSEEGLKKGPWTPEEDQKLIDYIHKHGLGSWRALPKRAGLNRCGKSCRLRWTNYLRPDIKRGNFSQEEENIIINLHSVLGNKWSRIAANLPGRTDNEIKNLWNTHLRKKLLQMGVDPNTHKPVSHLNFLVNLSQLLSTSNLSHIMNPWATTLRLQSDATQLANIQLLQNLLQVTNTSPIPNMEPNYLLGSQNIPNLDINPQLPSDHHEITSLPSCFGGGFGSEILNFNFNSLSGKCTYEREDMLPELVSATPENSIVNQMESKEPNYIPTDTGGSNIFETNWEKIVDDEAISFLLKDIME